MVSFMAMIRRASVRILAMVWATLQLASPGTAAVADGLLASASASAPTTHVEAKTGAGCHAVHSPDCALCRYVSHSAVQSAVDSFTGELGAHIGKPARRHRAALVIALTLPHGRAPPVG